MKTVTNRQAYIDWLRAGAMFFLIIYHSGRLFDFDGWHIKNAELSFFIEIFNRTLDMFQMPLFFLLAGMSVWFALERRSLKEFALERVLRLFVPLVFSMLMIVPPQVYLERIFRGQFSGTYFDWWPNTFSGPYPEGNLSWHHLWFLAYLFTFSLILIPVFRYFRSDSGRRLISRTATFLSKPGAILIPAVPLILINLTLRPIYGFGTQNLVNDWANFFFYITVVIYGFLLVSNEDLLRSFDKVGKVALIVAPFLTVMFWISTFEYFNSPELDLIGGIAEFTLYPIACWFWLIGIISMGRKYLNFNNKVLDYASAANMPVYVLHQTVIVFIGFFVVQTPLPVWVKYPMVIAGAFTLSLAGYEIIKRVNILRFLFGLKVRRRPAPAGVPQSAVLR